MKYKKVLKKMAVLGLIVALLVPNVFSLGKVSANTQTIETPEDKIVLQQKLDYSESELEGEEFYSLFKNMPNVRYGYIDKDGIEVEVSKNIPQSRATLDTTEWTNYNFRVDLNGYWIQGLMPILKIDNDVVFCIEPAVVAQEGGGYHPAQLPPNMLKKVVHVGVHGYEKMPSHESYVATQGYIWELLGATFTTDYAGYQSMKTQIDQNITNYFVRPSFHNQTVTVKANESITLTDTNNVLSEYVKDKSTGNLSVSKNGNELTIGATANSSENAKVEMWKATSVGTSIAYQKEGSQQVAKFELEDPVPFTLNVKVEKKGKIQLLKTDDETGEPLANVKFKMTGLVDGKEKEATYTTDKHGNAVSIEFDADSEATIVEVATLTGYILDSTPHKVKVVAGQTITVPLKNKVQKGRVKGHKEKEVFNAEKTEEQGSPVFEVFSAENIVFNIVAKNDITRPDKKTVVHKAGTIVDIVKTDKDGNFASNVDLYIGEQNQYQLVELNVPDNYRSPSDVQTTFSIPYGDSTEKLIIYDLNTIENLLKTGQWELNKVNEITGTNIAGAVFYIKGISKHNKGVQYKFTTEESKSVLSKLPEGDYQVIEVAFPDGYVQADGESETKIITVQDNEMTTTTWKNKKVEPKIGTQATGINGEKAFDPTKENTVIDKISYEGFEKNKEYTRVTQLVDVKNGEVILSQEDKVLFDSTKGTDNVEMVIPADTVKVNGDYVFFEFYYTDEEKENMFAGHKDINDKDQTITFVEKKIGTQATGINGEKTFDPTKENTVVDKISYEGFEKNKEYTRVTQLINVKTGELVLSQEDKVSFTTTEGTDAVEMVIPANTIKVDGDYVFFEEYFKDSEKKELFAGHKDINDKEQTITFKTTPNKEPEQPKGFLPSTGEQVRNTLFIGGLLIILGVIYFVLKKRKLNDEEKNEVL